MVAQTTFVRTNGVVVLDAVAHVGLNLAFVIHPSDAELIHAIWNAETLDEVHLIELWVLVVLFLDCTENFFYCLMILRFVWKATLKVFQLFYSAHGTSPINTLKTSLRQRRSVSALFDFGCKVIHFLQNLQKI